MPSNEQATVSADGQDCFSARALTIDQQNNQELLHQLFRMAFPTCLTSVLSGPEEQHHLRLASGAGGEQKQQRAEQCSFLCQEGLQQKLLWFPRQPQVPLVSAELTGQIMPHP